jgi:hypothetical protein
VINEVVQHLIESINFRLKQEKESQRSAKKYRQEIDKNLFKRRKEEEKNRKKEEKDQVSAQKKSVNQTITLLRKSSKSQSELFEIILSYRHKVSPEVYEFCKFISGQVDRLKTKQKEGTLLVSKNYLLIPKILDNPLVKHNQDPRVLKTVAKIYRLISPGINDRLDPNQNQVLNFKAINNMLFNALRDLALELLRPELMHGH